MALGAGLPDLLPSLDNPLTAQLAEDRLSATIIADGVHVPSFALKPLVRAKGVERAVLVTAAAAPAAAEPGLYPFADMEVLHEGDFVLRSPCGRAPCGSALTLDRAVRNLVRWQVAERDQAVRMASANPAALLARLGIRPPEAEIEWSADMHVLRLRCGGIDLRPATSAVLMA